MSTTEEATDQPQPLLVLLSPPLMWHLTVMLAYGSNTWRPEVRCSTLQAPPDVAFGDERVPFPRDMPVLRHLYLPQIMLLLEAVPNFYFVMDFRVILKNRLKVVLCVFNTN